MTDTPDPSDAIDWLTKAIEELPEERIMQTPEGLIAFVAWATEQYRTIQGQVEALGDLVPARFKLNLDYNLEPVTVMPLAIVDHTAGPAPEMVEITTLDQFAYQWNRARGVEEHEERLRRMILDARLGYRVRMLMMTEGKLY